MSEGKFTMVYEYEEPTSFVKQRAPRVRGITDLNLTI